MVEYNLFICNDLAFLKLHDLFGNGRRASNDNGYQPAAAACPDFLSVRTAHRQKMRTARKIIILKNSDDIDPLFFMNTIKLDVKKSMQKTRCLYVNY